MDPAAAAAEEEEERGQVVRHLELRKWLLLLLNLRQLLGLQEPPERRELPPWQQGLRGPWLVLASLDKLGLQWELPQSPPRRCRQELQ